MPILEPIEEEKESFTEESFREFLEECYPETVTICGMEFDQTYTFERLDPVAFRCAMNDAQEYTTVYFCPLCQEEHEEYEEAKFCCQEEEDND